MEILNEYITLCRLIGSWTDWVQGAGGNISVKNETDIIVKQSGFVIGNTTKEKGWLLLKIDDIRSAFENNNENLNVNASIETFLHILPSKIVVHVHPFHLFNILCDDRIIEIENVKFVPYVKPGLKLAKSVFDSYEANIKIYFLQNHGIIVCGDNINEIMCHLKKVSNLFKKQCTNIDIISKLFFHIKQETGVEYIIKPYLYYNTLKSAERIFFPYTPDIVIFLQEAPFCIEHLDDDPVVIFNKYVNRYNKIPTVLYILNTIYILAETIEKCNSIYEILYGYFQIEDKKTFLQESEVNELTTWDKEKFRKDSKV